MSNNSVYIEEGVITIETGGMKMRCTQCNQENRSDAVFCKTCGQALIRENVEEFAAVTDEVVNGVTEGEANSTAAENENVSAVTVQSNKSRIMGKLMISIGGGILALIIIIAVIVAIASDSFKSSDGAPALVNFIANGLSSGTTDDNYVTISYLYNDDTERTTVLVNEALTNITVSDSVAQVYSNLAGDINAVLTSDNTLYYVTTKESAKIAYDVEYFVVANRGNVVAYKYSDNTLYLYDGQKKSKTRIAEDIEGGRFALSPDGKVVSYTSDDDLYLYTRGESKYIAGGMDSISVTDDGMIYAIKDKKVLYSCTIKGGTSKVASDIDTILMINNDCSEILFTSNNKVCISINGGEKVKIGNYSYLKPISPNILHRRNHATNIEYGMDSLLDKLYLSQDDNLIYLNSKLESNKISSSKLMGYPLVINNKSAIYLSTTERVYSIVINSIGKEATPELLAKDVENWVVTSDGKTIYYTDKVHRLWCRNGLSEPMHIEDSVYKIAMTQKDMLLYITVSESELSLGYVKNKGQDKAIVDSDITSLMMTPNTVYYEKVGDTDGRDIYISDGSEKFVRVGVDIQQSLKADQYSVEIFTDDSDRKRESAQSLTYDDFDFYVDGVKVTDCVKDLDNDEFRYVIYGGNVSSAELMKYSYSDISTKKGIGIGSNSEDFLEKYGDLECCETRIGVYYSSIKEFFDNFNASEYTWLTFCFFEYNDCIYGAREFYEILKTNLENDTTSAMGTVGEFTMHISVNNNSEISGMQFTGNRASSETYELMELKNLLDELSDIIEKSL